MTSWLIDKSALARLGSSPDAAEWAARIGRGLVRVSVVTLLEVGFSARSATDLRSTVARPPVSSMPIEHFTPRIEDRALEVQAMLADVGQHRAPAIPELLVAATAEVAQLTVLHLDKDFELIAELTGQRIERLTLV